MKKLLFSGYYGMKNYGDDLFGIVSNLGLRQYWGDCVTTILGTRIKGEDINFSVPDWFPADSYADIGWIGKACRLLFLLKDQQKADKVIFSGGSLFSSKQSKVRELVIKLSGKNSQLYSGIGVSIGPFESIASEKKIAELLKRFEFLSLRDSASFELAQSFNLDLPVVLSRDLAGLMPLYVPTNKKDKSNNIIKEIGFSPCNFGGSGVVSKNICDAFVRSMEFLKDELNLKVMVLNLNEHQVLGDLRLCEYVCERLLHAGIDNELVSYLNIGVRNMWARIADCEIMVSVRLHGAITAYLCKVPFVLFEYHPKCKNFLDDIGVEANQRIHNDFKSPYTIEDVVCKAVFDYDFPALDSMDYSLQSASNFNLAPWAC